MTRTSPADRSAPPALGSGTAAGGGTTPSRLLIPTLVLSGVVTSLVQSIVAPILPVVMASTGSTFASASWLLTSTLLAGAVAAPLLSRLGDQLGRRRILLVCLLLLLLGSIGCVVSNQLPVLIAARAVQGAGMAVVPLGLGILRAASPGRQTIRSAGILSASMGVGGAFGVPFGGLVVEITSWHTMFLVIAVLAAVAMVAVLRVVPKDDAHVATRIDIGGAVGISAGLVALLLAITNGERLGWDSPAVVGLFVGAGATLVLSGVYESRVRDPLVDLRLNRRRPILLINLSALLIGFAFYGNTLVTSLLVQEPRSTGYGLGLSLALTGLTLLPGSLGVVTMAPISARLSIATSPRVSLIVGAGIMAAGYAFRFALPDHLATIIVGAAIISIGLGIAYAAYPALVLSEVDEADTAAVNGINTLARLLGSTICGAVIAALLGSLTTTIGGQEYPTLDAYRTIFVLAFGLSLLGLLLAVLIPTMRARARTRAGRP